MFKIEKDIPVAPIERDTSLYPWRNMEVGDSIIIERPEHQFTARSAASAYGKKHKMKFVSRKLPEGMRIWRVK